jgi:hypothetical protein
MALCYLHCITFVALRSTQTARTLEAGFANHRETASTKYILRWCCRSHRLLDWTPPIRDRTADNGTAHYYDWRLRYPAATLGVPTDQDTATHLPRFYHAHATRYYRHSLTTFLVMTDSCSNSPIRSPITPLITRPNHADVITWSPNSCCSSWTTQETGRPCF